MKLGAIVAVLVLLVAGVLSSFALRCGPRNLTSSVLVMIFPVLLVYLILYYLSVGV